MRTFRPVRRRSALVPSAPRGGPRTLYTSQAGEFHSSDTWGGSSPPTALDTAILGHAVTLTSADATCALVIGDSTNGRNGSLEITGRKLTLAGASSVGAGTGAVGTLTFGAGAELDLSSYDLTLLNCRMLSTATSGSWAKVTGSGGIKNCVVSPYASGNAPQEFDLDYVSFQHTGTLEMRCGGGSSGTITAKVDLDYCAFVGQSTIRFGLGSYTAATTHITLDRCDFRNLVPPGSGDYRAIHVSGIAPTTGSTKFTYCTFSQSSYATIQPNRTGVELEHCVLDNFGEEITYAPGSGIKFDRCFFTLPSGAGSTQSGFLMLQDNGTANEVTDNYFFAIHANPHCIKRTGTTKTAANVVTGNVFEIVYNTNGANCILLGGGSTQAERNLLIGCGSLVTAAGDPSVAKVIGTVTVKRNTAYMTDNSSGDYPLLWDAEHAPHGYTIDSLRIASNLISGSVTVPKGIGPISDAYITIDYSNYNLFDGVTLDYFDSTTTPAGGAFTILDGQDNDLFDVDPDFEEPTRNLAAYSTYKGGAGTVADSIAKLLEQNGYSGTTKTQSLSSSGYTAEELVGYVRGGFVPHNAALDGAGDPADGSPDIGALDAEILSSTKTVSDTGTGADAVSIGVAATVTDAGAGTDAATKTTGATATLTASVVRRSRKWRPWSSPPADTTLTQLWAPGQRAAVQVALMASDGDILGVNVAATTPSGFGSPVIYKEVPYLVLRKSRNDGATGEWPHGLIPKVDPYFSESRSAFPFDLRLVSTARIGAGDAQAYPRYDLTSAGTEPDNPVTRINGALSLPTITGTYSVASQLQYNVKIDTAGGRGTATFKWSNNGGGSWGTTLVSIPANGGPVTLENGLSVTWPDQTYTLNDEWTFFASPDRVEMVYVEWRIPPGQTPGSYSSTITVSATGQADQTLTVNFDVIDDLVVPATSSIPAFYIFLIDAFMWGHYSSYTTTWSLHQDYLEEGLRHRISMSGGAPWLTFTPGSGVIGGWSTYRNWLAPYLDGSWSEGSKLTLWSPRMPSGYSAMVVYQDSVRKYDLTANEKDYLAVLAGNLDAEDSHWWDTVFLLTLEEPQQSSLPADWPDASHAASASIWLAGPYNVLATEQYTASVADDITIWCPSLLAGASTPRSSYDAEIAAGKKLIHYTACDCKGCSVVGGSTYDKYPTDSFDHDLPLSKVGYFFLMWANDFRGDFYYHVTHPYKHRDPADTYKHDPWDCCRTFGGDGEGCYFLPGRPDKIGGTNHIPCPTMSLKGLLHGLEAYEILKAASDLGYRGRVLQIVEDVIGTNKYYFTSPPAADDLDDALDEVLDLFSWTIKSVTESGHGSDSPAVTADEILKTISDLCHGTDSPAIAVSFTLADTGTGTDTISAVQTILKTVTDAGAGTDVASISVRVTLPDTGSATDTIAGILAMLAVTDTGAGVDVALAILPDNPNRVVVTFTLKKPGATFALKRPTATLDIL